MSNPDLELIRNKLMARRDTLLSERGRSMRRIEESTYSTQADPMDQAAGNCDFDVAVGQAHIESEEFASIMEALEKLEAGNFGVCEECDQAIGRARIEALPQARFCIDCQRLIESGDLVWDDNELVRP